MKGGFRGKLHLRGFLGSLPSWWPFWGVFLSETGWGGGMGRAGINDVPPKSCWEYLDPPPIQQHPFSWKGLGAQKGGCAFCDCQG